LSRPKDRALPGLYIGRYSPQPQSHVERIDPERGPEGKLTNPMLFRMADGAQWNGVAIARLHPYTTIGCCTHIAQRLMALLDAASFFRIRPFASLYANSASFALRRSYIAIMHSSFSTSARGSNAILSINAKTVEGLFDGGAGGAGQSAVRSARSRASG